MLTGLSTISESHSLSAFMPRCVPPVLMSHFIVVLAGPGIVFGFRKGLDSCNRRRRIVVRYTLRSVAGVFMRCCSHAAVRM
jgi:hypothetical protein